MLHRPGSADSGSDCQRGVPAKRMRNNHIKLTGYSIKTLSPAGSRWCVKQSMSRWGQRSTKTPKKWTETIQSGVNVIKQKRQPLNNLISIIWFNLWMHSSFYSAQITWFRFNSSAFFKTHCCSDHLDNTRQTCWLMIHRTESSVETVRLSARSGMMMALSLKSHHRWWNQIKRVF